MAKHRSPGKSGADSQQRCVSVFPGAESQVLHIARSVGENYQAEIAGGIVYPSLDYEARDGEGDVSGIRVRVVERHGLGNEIWSCVGAGVESSAPEVRPGRGRFRPADQDLADRDRQRGHGVQFKS